HSISLWARSRAPGDSPRPTRWRRAHRRHPEPRKGGWPSRLPLRPASAAARVEKLRRRRAHAGLLELLTVAEAARGAAGLGLLVRQDEGDGGPAATRPAGSA